MRQIDNTTKKRQLLGSKSLKWFSCFGVWFFCFVFVFVFLMGRNWVSHLFPGILLLPLLPCSVQLQHSEGSDTFQCMLDYFLVSMTHPTLTWTTGSLTCVCVVFLCMRMYIYIHGGPGFTLQSHPKDVCINPLIAPACIYIRRFRASLLLRFSFPLTLSLPCLPCCHSEKDEQKCHT